MAVLLAEAARNVTLLTHRVTSARGLAPACMCAASEAAQANALTALAAAAAEPEAAWLQRVSPVADPAYRNACLRECVAASAPAEDACGEAHAYALLVDEEFLLELSPGTALPDATHTGVPSASQSGVASALAAALARRAQGYLLWVSLDDSHLAALPILLRADVAWTYDAGARAWVGGTAPDVLHTPAFKLHLARADVLLEQRARHTANAALFAARFDSNASDVESLFFMALALKEAGLFSQALPAADRHVLLAASAGGQSLEARSQLFLSHMLRGRIHAARGSMDVARLSFLDAVVALPARRVEALTELAKALRQEGRMAQALPYARAAAEAALREGLPVEGRLFLVEGAYEYVSHLEVSLSAYSASDIESLSAGVEALTVLLNNARLARRYWLASFDNAAAYVAKMQAYDPLPRVTRTALDAMSAAMQPREPTCMHEHVALGGGTIDAADASACGSDSILGSLFSAVAVIEMPTRERHVASFLASMGCIRYLRFPAVMHLTPAELSRDHNPRLRNGEMRLIQAHACVLAYAASLPADSRPLAIFEDDVAPVPPNSLPAVRLAITRLLTAAPTDAELLLLGRCPCMAVSHATVPDEVVPISLFYCAHAYAVTPAGGAKLHAELSTKTYTYPLDVVYVRMVEAGRLRAYTNAGPSMLSQQQLSGALNDELGKGASKCRLPPLTVGVDGWPVPARAALRLAVVGGWISPQTTADEMWLLLFVLQNVTGRAVELVPLTRAGEVDVFFVSVFMPSRAEVEDLHSLHGGRAVFLFAVGENTQWQKTEFHDLLLPLADLSLGHRRDINAPNYMYFPWWIPTALVRRSASTALDAIVFHPALRRRADAAAWSARPGFALFINAHEAAPRRELVELVATLGSVASPGRALNNMRWPSDVSNDLNGKRELLSRHRFALVPENSVSVDGGYVTEKLPQAHLEGAVPVYWGDAARPDTDVWNLRRVLLYANGSSNAALMETMLRLTSDAVFREQWFSEPVLKPDADAWVARFLNRLAGHMRRALATKHVAVFES